MTVVALISVLLLVSVLAFETRVCSRAISLIQDATGGRTLREPTVQAFHAVAEKTRQSLRGLRPLARSHDAQFSRTELLLRGKLQKKRVTNHSHALLARGLCDAAEFDHDENLSIVEQYLHRFVDLQGRWSGRCRVIDDFAVGDVLLEMHQRTGKPCFMDGAVYCARHLLDKHPRNSAGLLCYRGEFPEIMLVDDKGMICSFLVRFGLLAGDKDALRLGLDQMTGFLSRSVNTATGFPYHAFDLRSGKAFGPSTWLRGVGWLSLGLADVSSSLPEGHPVRSELADRFVGILQSLEGMQLANGCWRWDVENPLAPAESSGTAMIGCAIERACAGGLIDRKWLKLSEKALDGVLSHTLRNGTVVHAQAECEGIGNYSGKFLPSNYAQGPALSLFAAVRRRKV